MRRRARSSAASEQRFDSPPEIRWGTRVTEILRDQQTLEPLEPVDGGFHAPGSGRDYVVRDGLLFMGYDARFAARTQHLIEEERVWQGTVESVAADELYLRATAPRAVDLLNLTRSVGGLAPGSRALDLGSGAGWGGWLLAEAGYDTWLLDFEANSLALGLVYDHPGLRGRRVVADASLPPFADGSFDLVVSQQFIHHIEEKGQLLAEVDRILRPGGIFALTEPALSLWTAVLERRHPDPHEAHRIAWPTAYLRDLRASGFEVLLKGPVYGESAPGRFPFTSAIKRRSTRRVVAGRSAWDPLSLIYAHLIGGGGGLLIIARKAREARAIARPGLRLMESDQVRVTDTDREAHRPFLEIVRQQADRLEPLQGEDRGAAVPPTRA